MDRAALEQMLGEGLSLAEMGRRLGRHESTVSYWLGKHGLEAVGRARHAPKGELSRELLAPLVEAGMSVAQIARSLGREKTSVRHWLREHGLQTVWAERRAGSRAGKREMQLRCTRHGMTAFRLRRSGGYRCVRCRAEAVSRRRRKVKRTLVEEAGGACGICRYNRCISALEFHHVLPSEKRFSLSYRGVARSLERARAEASKCVLLCANCHAEVEAGVTALAGLDFAALQCVRPPDDEDPR
jgi:transposase